MDATTLRISLHSAPPPREPRPEDHPTVRFPDPAGDWPSFQIEGYVIGEIVAVIEE
jgi:hypothetical protein